MAKRTTKKTTTRTPKRSTAAAASRRRRSSRDTAAKLVALAQSLAKQAKRKEDPSLAIPTRALSNVSFSSRKGILEMGSAAQTRSF
ncbi:MAG: hypothetical protein D6824_07720, partial [Planctomycetota bacterium]